MRVPSFLADQHIDFETIIHPPAYSAQKRAKVLHWPGKLVAKCILLADPQKYFLAVLPATHQVDTEALGSWAAGTVRLADNREITELFRDCEWGVVTPFGTLYRLAVVLEESIDPEAMMVFEGNVHGEAIRMRCRDFEKLESPCRLRFGLKT